MAPRTTYVLRGGWLKTRLLAAAALVLAGFGLQPLSAVAQTVSTPEPTAAAQAAPTSAAAKPLTVDSTIGDLLDNPPTHAVLQRQVPAIASSPQISQARGMSLRAIAPFAPTVLTKERLQAIDEELARTPGAVTNGATRSASAPDLVDTMAALTLRTVPLWPGRAPGALGDKPQDIPTLTIVAPDGAVSFGTAVIVAPGGGYLSLATGHEGREVADWFAAHGVTAFVLRYRLTPFGYHHPTQLRDAQRAIRWVRAHAQDYGVDPHRIGMIGFSAGGHLTAMAETLFDAGDPKAADPVDRVGSRPDFAILGYPVIQIDDPMQRLTAIASGKPSSDVLRQLSPALNVTAQTPPTFIFQTTTDEVVDPRNATLFYGALRAANVPAELHIFAQGRHGLGLAMTEPALSVWPSLLQTWLGAIGMIGPTVAAH